MNKLFVYGSLMDHYTRQSVFGKTLDYEKLGKLPGYCAVKNDKIGWVSYVAEPVPDGAIYGMVLNLSDEELSIADAYRAGCYRREKKRLEDGTEVYVYMAPPPECGSDTTNVAEASSTLAGATN